MNFKERALALYQGFSNMPLLWQGTLFGLTQFKDFDFPVCTTVEITRENQRLGKLAEELYSWGLQRHPNYELVFENLQIIANKQTLGELDVCVFDKKNQEYLHIELITKFYLYNPKFPVDAIAAWIGPNRNDSLLSKTQKLSQKQLPLLHKPETLTYLKEFGLSPEIKQKVCYKAWLFLPLNQPNTLKKLNPLCVAGHYMNLENFSKLYPDTLQFYCPRKQDWLRFPESQPTWQTKNEVLPFIEEFMHQFQAILVWVKNENKFERVIVVPYDEM